LRRSPAGAGLILTGAGLVVLHPATAAAHGMLQGVGTFYAGLLHPLLVPAEALALVATALQLGSTGRAACRVGILALAAGLAAGLALGRHVPPSFATPALLAVAFLAAGLVTAGIRLPSVAAAAVAALAGIAVGIDARPDAGALHQAITTGAATVVGASALVVVVAALALREPGWQSVAVRVSASWITASAILYFAWLATSAPT
jgi:urease accessory protein